MNKPQKTALNFKVREISNENALKNPKDELPDSIKRALAKFREQDNFYEVLICFTIFIVLQIVVSTCHYSGFRKPPMYGDFEAQRHWMEITINLPVSDWYVNTTQNDLNYWGLDYPPLTAYHSFLLGKIFQRIEPRWTALFTSRGVEDPYHKVFMRLSVIVTMIALYMPAVFVLYRRDAKFRTKKSNYLFAAALSYPGLIFVDNGHFQYNHIALGLFLWGVHKFETRRYLIGSIFFVLALNFKQMELYHALPIFVFLLSRSFEPKGSISQRIFGSLWNVTKLGSVVIATFAVLWAPFLSDLRLATAVLRRLFPINRGVFEDKVANFWYCLSVVVKIKQKFSNDFLAGFSACLVLATILPSLFVLLRRSSERNFRMCLVISSLSFYLFSFQVHEKSILQVVIPALLIFEELPSGVHWFLSISLFSLYPLCIKDEMPEILPLFVTYFFYVNFVVKMRPPKWESLLIRLAKWLNFAMALAICAMLLFVQPSARYPHLFQLFNAVFSFGHFAAFLFYANFCLFKWNYCRLDAATKYKKTN